MSEPRPSDAALRRRISGAAMDLAGVIDDRLAWHIITKAVPFYLGPSVGLSFAERWQEMSSQELEILAEALEERAAMGADWKACF